MTLKFSSFGLHVFNDAKIVPVKLHCRSAGVTFCYAEIKQIGEGDQEEVTKRERKKTGKLGSCNDIVFRYRAIAEGLEA